MPTVQTNGIETYYERRGTGPPVVFVHGAIVDHSQWDPQAEALSDEYETVAYDVRGHGRTGGSDRRQYSMDLFAEDLAALVDGLDLDDPVICGLSTGGCVAQVYAARHSDRISGLVLAGTFGPEIYGWGERFQRSLALRVTIPPVRLFGYERVEKAMVWLTERFQPGAGGDYERIEELRAEGPGMSTAEFAKVIRAVAAFHRTRIDLSAVAVPTLVLHGEKEPGFIRRQASKLEETIPDARVLEVPGAGHASNLDEPEFFTDAVREFLHEVRPPAPRDVEGTETPD